jgi:hypothetical protein
MSSGRALADAVRQPGCHGRGLLAAGPGQSASKSMLFGRETQPVGQQPSTLNPEQLVRGTWRQRTLHISGTPSSRSSVQLSPSSGQLVGQLEDGSQLSPLSTRPLPHLGTQSESVCPVQLDGQQ